MIIILENTYILRLANLLHNSNIDVKKIWTAVREIKLKTSLDGFCGTDNLYHRNSISKDDQTIALEQHLKISRPWGLVRFQNITNETLKTAAEILIYLNSCPGPLKSWFVFYKDLFENQPKDQIILTLNRMIKFSSKTFYEGKKIVLSKLSSY